MTDDARALEAGAPAEAGAAAKPAERWKAVARTFGVDVLHLLVLSSFAVARPLFQVLGQGATFFAVRGSSATEIVEFALIVTFVPVLALGLAEVVVQLVAGRLARRMAHLVFVAFLCALIAIQALKHLGVSAEHTLFAASGLVGLAAAILYAVSRPARTLPSVLGPAPLLFLVLFLFFSPVAKLVMPGQARAAATKVESQTPVVLVVFDEFTVESLMDPRGRIDPIRYPNFAALSHTATWFRNYATVGLVTTRVIPALLTGKYTKRSDLPIFSDHPDNLFTLLGSAYRLNVHETETRLCPRSLCPEAPNAIVEPGLRSLFTDVSIVFGHMALPGSVADRLPSISTSWGNFRGRDIENGGVVVDQASAYANYLQSIRPSSGPALYYLHVELPHFPWNHLPSGQTYPAPNDFIPGLRSELWGHDRWLAEQAHQRHLLQAGFTDLELGRLLRTLRRSGLFDRALLIVTADEGVSFHAGESRRLTRAHREDLAFVPLFVKKPRQTSGLVVDRVVQTIDVLPAIAEELHVRIPWHVDGRSLFGGVNRARVRIDDSTFDAQRLVAGRNRAVVRQARMFGADESWARVYAAGPNHGLLGQPVPAGVPAATDVTATLAETDQLTFFDPANGVVPSFVSGVLHGPGARTGVNVAVAVNGQIAGVGRSYARAGSTLFSALVPPEVFRRGANHVVVYRVRSARAVPSLQEVAEVGGADQTTYTLRPRGRRGVIVPAHGSPIRIVPGAVEAFLDGMHVTGTEVRFAGWAADPKKRRVRDEVLVFANGRFVFSYSTPYTMVVPNGRTDLGPGLADAGFAFTLPLSSLRRAGVPRVRLFAVIGTRASELVYPPGYPWGG